MARLLVLLLLGAILLVPGAAPSSAKTPAGCGPLFLLRLPSLGTVTWRTATRGEKDWHGLGYRPTPPIATTEATLRIGNRVVARKTVNEAPIRLPLLPDRLQRLELEQGIEPGTLRASIVVDFQPGTTSTYCAPYLPPGLKITLRPRS